MSPARDALGLFGGVGVEMEYMLVHRDTLDVLPVSDRVLERVAGRIENEVEVDGAVAWSNELVLHVIEFKTNGPAASLEELPAAFAASVTRCNELLAPLDGRLMPTAMHPWMDPSAETRLWPHDDASIYRTFDRVFDCRGHGWSNLQSTHLNLPFRDDEEFGRLHAAVRLVVPLIPALAAASPVAEGRPTGRLDTRMVHYQGNARRVPSVSGRVVPEAAWTRRQYRDRILAPIYRDLAPHDPEKVLRHEWVNARGAIARFDRNAIEIRVLDAQECPRADLAVCAAVWYAVRALVEGRWCSTRAQQAWEVGPLAAILDATCRAGERAVIDDPRYGEVFGLRLSSPLTAGDLWRHLVRETVPAAAAEGPWGEALAAILARGPLARRILSALGPEPSRARLRAVYRSLCDCLAEGRIYTGEEG